MAEYGIAFAVQAQPLFNPRFQVAGRGQYYAALVLELIIQAYEMRNEVANNRGADSIQYIGMLARGYLLRLICAVCGNSRNHSLPMPIIVYWRQDRSPVPLSSR